MPLRHLAPLVHTVDLLVPVSAFGRQESFEPVGATRWVADVLVAAGWILATALVTGTSRVLGRNRSAAALRVRAVPCRG